MQPSVHARKAATGKKPHGCSAKSVQKGTATGSLLHILNNSSAFRSIWCFKYLQIRQKRGILMASQHLRYWFYILFLLVFHFAASRLLPDPVSITAITSSLERSQAAPRVGQVGQVGQVGVKCLDHGFKTMGHGFMVYLSVRSKFLQVVSSWPTLG